MGYRRLAEGVAHTGGVVAATRSQGRDRNWRSPVCPKEKSSEKVGPITADAGKGTKAAGWRSGP
jgi:hypothetical protein